MLHDGKRRKPSYSSHVLVSLFYGGLRKLKPPFLVVKYKKKTSESKDYIMRKWKLRISSFIISKTKKSGETLHIKVYCNEC